MSTNYQVGSAGFTTTPRAVGEENILNANGVSIGRQYADLDRTIFEMAQANAKPFVMNTGKGIFTPGDPSAGTADTWANPNMFYFSPPMEALQNTNQLVGQGGGANGWAGNDGAWDELFGSYTPASTISLGDVQEQSIAGGYTPKYFSDEASLWNALNGSTLFTYQGGDFYGRPQSGGDLRSLNTYGQMLAGDLFPNDAQSWRDFGNIQPGQQFAPKAIRGQDALAGSQPVIQNGQVVGYQLDLNFAKPGDYGYVGSPFGLQMKDTNGATISNNTISWNPGDVKAWESIGKSMGDGKWFIPTENVGKIPGFTPRNTSFYYEKPDDDGGLFGGSLGKILSIAAMIGKFVPGPWTPAAYVYTAASALEQKNPFKLVGAALGAFGGDMFGETDFFGEGTAGAVADWGDTASSAMDFFGEGTAGAFADFGGGGFGDFWSATEDWGNMSLGAMGDMGAGGGGWEMPSFTMPGGMDMIKGGMSIGSGLYGMKLARDQMELAKRLGKRSDPWGNSGGRQLADSQLQELMRSPGGLQSDPGYQARMQGVQRQNAAYGSDSGAMAVAAANASGDYYGQRLQQLAALAGAPGNPGGGAQMEMMGNAQGASLAGPALASIGYGVSRMAGPESGMPPEVVQWLMRQQGAR